MVSTTATYGKWKIVNDKWKMAEPNRSVHLPFATYHLPFSIVFAFQRKCVTAKKQNPRDSSRGFYCILPRGKVTGRGESTAQGVAVYGCTFRPDQVHNFPLRGSPPSPLTRAGEICGAGLQPATDAGCKPAPQLLWSSLHRRLLDCHLLGRTTTGRPHVADGLDRGQRRFIDGLAEGRVLLVKKILRTQTDEEPRARRIGVVAAGH